MKPIIKIMLIGTIMIKCSFCKDCTNKLEAVFKQTGYKNNQIIQFINDSGKIRNDTISIEYYPPNYEYCRSPLTSTEETSESSLCVGNIYIKSASFKINYFQASNLSNNIIERIISINGINIQNQFGYRIDTIIYNYNGVNLNSIRYKKEIIKSDSLHNTCSQCIISMQNNILLYYSISNNSIITNWKLK
jgi:hypothetical protein